MPRFKNASSNQLSTASKKRRMSSKLSIPKRLNPYGFNAEHKFKRTCSVNLILNTSSGWFGNAGNSGMAFVFSTVGVTIQNVSGANVTVSLPQTTEFTQLFDQIRIDKVIMRIQSLGSEGPNGLTSVVTLNGAAIPFALGTDYNDAVAPTTLAEVQAISDCDVVVPSPGSVYTKTIRPKYLSNVYYSAVLSNYESKIGFTNTSLAVPHYGLKFATIPPVGTLNQSTNSMIFSFDFYLTCKNSD